MSSDQVDSFKPVLSVGLIIVSLLCVVFFQMEERRLGYSLLKVSSESRKIAEQKKSYEIQLAQKTRPYFLEKMASAQFTLKKAESHQIILLPNFALNSESGELFE
jgi:hypothetical protein